MLVFRYGLLFGSLPGCGLLSAGKEAAKAVERAENNRARLEKTFTEFLKEASPYALGGLATLAGGLYGRHHWKRRKARRSE